MARSHQVQVTLDSADYEAMRRLAGREGASLAAVAREAILRFCVEPETVRRQRRALAELAALEPAPAPESLRAWKHEYGRSKAGVGLPIRPAGKQETRTPEKQEPDGPGRSDLR